MELSRLARAVRHRWRIVVLISLLGAGNAVGFTLLANLERNPLYETIVSIRFEPEEGESLEDLAGTVQSQHELAVFANQDLLGQVPGAVITPDTTTGRLFFQAQGESEQLSVERVNALVDNYRNTDPVQGGDIEQRLLRIVEEAEAIEADMAELQSRPGRNAVLIQQHDLLDQRIAAVNNQIVQLTVADIGASPQEQAANAAQRDDADQLLNLLLEQKQALPPRPSDDMSAGERLQLRALQRGLDVLSLEYEQLTLLRRGVAGSAGRIESIGTNDLTARPANPVTNGAIGLAGGAALAIFALMFITRNRREIWLGEDVPVPVLGEITGRKVSAVAGPPWYDSTIGGGRKESIQALRTALDGVLVHSSTALALVGDRVGSVHSHALAVDLAASFASVGRSVLLIDADYTEPADFTEYSVGEPTLASVLGLPSAFVQTLEERVSALLDEAVYLRSDLAVMPAGMAPSSPADAVAGRQLRVVLEQARSRFDLVVVVAGDASSSTGQVVAQRVGSALVAVTPGKSTVPHITSVVADLTQQRVAVVGAAMIYGSEGRAKSPAKLSSRPGKKEPEPQLVDSPLSRLHHYPFPGSKSSPLVEGGSLRGLAIGLGEDDGDEGDEATEQRRSEDALASQVLKALRESEAEKVYGPVTDYLVARVEDILTAVPGQANLSDPLIDVVLGSGFIPLHRVKGQRSIGEWLVEELRVELGRADGDELALELARVVGDVGQSPADTLNIWLASEFFRRHIERTHGEPEVWHLTSELGSVQLLVNGRRLTRERIGRLATDVVRRVIDDLERKLKRATEEEDTDEAAFINQRLKELHLLEINLGLLQVGSKEEARIIYPWRRNDQQPVGWAPIWAEGVRPNIAPLQRLGLLAFPVLSDEELYAAQPIG